MSVFQKNTGPPVSPFVGLSPGWESPEESCKGILSIASCRVNSTRVLDLGTHLVFNGCRLSDRWAFCDWLDTPACYSVAWKIAFGPA